MPSRGPFSLMHSNMRSARKRLRACGTAGPRSAGLALVGDSRVDLNVFRTDVEPHSSERLQALRVGFVPRSDQHEVEMPDPNVVRVDLNLLHGCNSPRGGFEGVSLRWFSMARSRICRRVSATDVAATARRPRFPRLGDGISGVAVDPVSAPRGHSNWT